MIELRTLGEKKCLTIQLGFSSKPQLSRRSPCFYELHGLSAVPADFVVLVSRHVSSYPSLIFVLFFFAFLLKL